MKWISLSVCFLNLLFNENIRNRDRLQKNHFHQSGLSPPVPAQRVYRITGLEKAPETNIPGVHTAWGEAITWIRL